MKAPVIERVKLTHELLARKMSDATIEAVAQIMESMRQERGYSETEAEAKAKEIRQMLETDIDEESLLKKLKQMK